MKEKHNPKYYYFDPPSQNEVDFVLDDGNRRVGLELKTASQWKSGFNHGLETLSEQKKIQEAIGVYDGSRDLVSNKVSVFTVKNFLKKLWQNEFF